MRYLSQPVEFVSAATRKSGDYTNYQIHVKDAGGYLSRFDCSQEVYEAAQQLTMGRPLLLFVLSYVKKYQRKDGSGSFYRHFEVVTNYRVADDAETLPICDFLRIYGGDN